MQLRRLAVLALAALLAACGSDDGGVADPADLRLQIVSGDRQTAPVRPAGVSSTASAQGAYLADLPPNLLPEPLVARIVVDGASPSASPLGPSFAALPSDLVVTFRVVQPQDQLGRDCGKSFIDSAKPDADGLVTTYWERGTIAGVECRLEVRLVVDGVPRVDTAFTATFEPGPAVEVRWGGSGLPDSVSAGDTLDLTDLIDGGRDTYGNPTSVEQTTIDIVASTGWVPSAASGQVCRIGVPTSFPAEGWTVVVPEEAAAWPINNSHGYNACLHLFINGRLRDRIPLTVH